MPMNAIERFLRTDPRDLGCDETRRLLHVYVEALLAGEDPELRYPGIAAHLRRCPPCADERDGLLAATGQTRIA
jgi:hypothetical protein